MPHKHKNGAKNARQGNRKTVKEHVVSVPFSYINFKTLVAGSGQASLKPALFPRMLDIADAYDMYRFIKLEYRAVLNCTGSANTDSWIMAFYPGIVDNAPVAFADISENLTYSFLPLKSTVNGNWVRVPKADLMGMGVWFKTIVGTPDPTDEEQGQFFFRTPGSTTDQCSYEVRGICQFKGATNTGATPMARAKIEMARERARLLAILEADSDDEEETPPPKPEKKIHGLLAKRLASPDK